MLFYKLGAELKQKLTRQVKMRSRDYKAWIFIAVALIAVIIFIWQVADKNSDNSQPSTTSSVKAPVNDVSYEGQAGKNALEILKSGHKTDTKSYKGLGEIVTGIDGTKADSKHFWSFYVNGKQSQVGAGSYVTKNGDKITWKLEEIK